MKAFIIYLNKSKTGKFLLEQTANKLEELSTGIDIIPFPATDRYRVWQEYADCDFVIRDLSTFGGGHLDTEIATFFSHYRLWKKCIELQENIIVLEHDAILESELDLESIDVPEEACVVNLGAPNWGTQSHLYNPREWTGEGLQVRELCENKHHIAASLSRCKCDTQWLYGAHAYIITPEGAEALINSTDNIKPADVFINVRTVKIYDYLPHLFRQSNEVSFIQRHSIPDSGQNVNPWDY